MRIKKLTFYLGHLMKMSTVNKIRIVLTSIGIFVAVFLFSAGIIISNSYYNGNKRIVEEMNANVAVVTSYLDSDTVKTDLSGITSVIPIEDELLAEKKSILSTRISTDGYLTVLSHFHGVTASKEIGAVVDDNGEFLPIDMELVEGRFISARDLSDAADVFVVDEITAQLLFPGESAVGKSINLNAGVGGSVAVSSNEKSTTSSAEIIGVVKSSRVSEARKLLLKKSMQLNESKNLFFESSVYCPIRTLQKWFPEQDSTRYYIYNFDDIPSRDKFVSSINTINDIKQRQGQFNVYDVITKNQLIDNIEKELTYVKQLLNIIVVLLCVISGLSIMSVTLFSVKERIPEIGIRKAFGASKADIIFQVIFEMISVAFMISVFAVCLSYYACKAAEGYLVSSLYISFNISVTLNQLALPVLVGTLEAFICSIIPGFFAANIKVTDALRFE